MQKTLDAIGAGIRVSYVLNVVFSNVTCKFSRVKFLCNCKFSSFVDKILWNPEVLVLNCKYSRFSVYSKFHENSLSNVHSYVPSRTRIFAHTRMGLSHMRILIWAAHTRMG